RVVRTAGGKGQRLGAIVIGLLGLRTEAGAGGQGSAEGLFIEGVARRLMNQAGAGRRIGHVGVEVVGRIGTGVEPRVNFIESLQDSGICIDIFDAVDALQVYIGLSSGSAHQLGKRVARIVARGRARGGDSHGGGIGNQAAGVNRHGHPTTGRGVFGNGPDNLIDAGTTGTAAGIRNGRGLASDGDRDRRIYVAGGRRDVIRKRDGPQTGAPNGDD